MVSKNLKKTIASIAAVAAAVSMVTTVMVAPVYAVTEATTTSVSAKSLADLKYTQKQVDLRTPYYAAQANTTFTFTGDIAVKDGGKLRFVIDTASYNPTDFDEGMVKKVVITAKSGSVNGTLTLVANEEDADEEKFIYYCEDLKTLCTSYADNVIEVELKDFSETFNTMLRTNNKLTAANSASTIGFAWNEGTDWTLRKTRVIDSISVVMTTETATKNAPTSKDLSALGDILDATAMSLTGDVREYAISNNVLYVAGTYDNTIDTTPVLSGDALAKETALKAIGCVQDFEQYISDCGAKGVKLKYDSTGINDYVKNYLLVDAYREANSAIRTAGGAKSNVYLYDSRFESLNEIKTKYAELNEYGDIINNYIAYVKDDVDNNSGAPATIYFYDSRAGAHPVDTTLDSTYWGTDTDGGGTGDGYADAGSVKFVDINSTVLADLNDMETVLEPIADDITATIKFYDVRSNTAAVQSEINKIRSTMLSGTFDATKGLKGGLNDYVTNMGYNAVVKDTTNGYAESTDYTYITTASVLVTALTNVGNELQNLYKVANKTVNSFSKLPNTANKTTAVTEAKPFKMVANTWVNIGSLYDANTGYPILAQLNTAIGENKGVKVRFDIDESTVPSDNKTTTVGGVFTNTTGVVGASRIRINGLFATDLSAIATYDTEHKCYEFDWDAITGGKPTWMLELATYDPLSITSITVCIPDQDEYLALTEETIKEDEEVKDLEEITSGESKEDDSEVIEENTTNEDGDGDDDLNLGGGEDDFFVEPADTEPVKETVNIKGDNNGANAGGTATGSTSNPNTGESGAIGILSVVAALSATALKLKSRK